MLFFDILTGMFFLSQLGDSWRCCLLQKVRAGVVVWAICLTASKVLTWIFNVIHVEIFKCPLSWDREIKSRSDLNVQEGGPLGVEDASRMGGCGSFCVLNPALHPRRVGLVLEIPSLHNIPQRFTLRRAFWEQAEIALKASPEYLAIKIILRSLSRGDKVKTSANLQSTEMCCRVGAH